MYLLPFLSSKVIVDTFLCDGVEVIGMILLSYVFLILVEETLEE